MSPIHLSAAAGAAHIPGNHSTSASFDQLFSMCMPIVHNELRRFPLPPQLRSDIAQDVAVVLYKRMHELTSVRSIPAWIRIIARRKAINAQKHADREVPHADCVQLCDAHPVTICATDADHDRWECLGLEAFHTQLAEEPSHNRGRVATMHYIDAVPVADIALRLDLPRNTVLSHLRRFRLLAQQRLAVSVKRDEQSNGL